MFKQASATKAHGTVRGATAITLFAATAVLAGCRQDMHNQPKFYPQRGSDFYADGRSVRPQVENTVARGQLHEDSYFYTGFQDNAEGATMPFPVTMDVLARGQERYNIFCTPCHSRVGNGVGMIVQRGYAQAGNFHTARLQAAPLGHFFNVITNGYGAMPNYAAQLTPEERWAVVAYIKALQLSQDATEGDVAAGEHPQPLPDISENEGFARNFAAEWALPPTAVTGTTTGQPYVLGPGDDGRAGPQAGEFPGQGSARRGATAAAPLQGGSVEPHGVGSSGYGAKLPGSPGPGVTKPE